MPSRPTRLAAAAGAVATILTFVLASPPPTLAFVASSDNVSLEILPPLDHTRYVFATDELAANVDVGNYEAQLEAELGAGWRVASWNPFSGTARSVSGPGILVAPTGLEHADEATVETLARSFIAAHAALFATDGSNLTTQRVVHGAQRWGVLFEQHLDGVPVQDSQVVIAMHDNGRLFAFGSHLYPNVAIDTTPTLAAVSARAIARAAVPYDVASDAHLGPDALVILAEHRGPGDVVFRLAHRTDVPTTEPYGSWRTWVDAHTGDILYRDNQVEFAYEGTAAGDVEVFSPCDGDTPDTPMQHMTIAIAGVGSVDTGDDGTFSLPGNAGTRDFTAQFNGPDFDIDCSGCGSDGELLGTITPDTPESVYFDGSFRYDERDAFHFANRTKLFAESIDPGFSQAKYTVNVNVPGSCNANWSGTTMNFFRAGGPCENMARVSDVVAHEFGHGIQNWALGGGQGPEGLGEGNADITSTFITDNYIVGIGVVDCVSGARVCDNDLVYPDDLTGQIHHDGQIICGFNWDCRLNMEPAMGFDDAKMHTATLWLFARKLFMNNSNTQPDQAERYLWVDDNDGDLSNGTPNFAAICQAMQDHGFVCPPVITTGVGTSLETPGHAVARLGAAQPNPFNPSTTIPFSLGEQGLVELGIYDVGGRLVRSLLSGERPAGEHVARWDGTFDDTTPASSGIYYYRLVVGDWSETRSMVLVK